MHGRSKNPVLPPNKTAEQRMLAHEHIYLGEEEVYAFH